MLYGDLLRRHNDESAYILNTSEQSAIAAEYESDDERLPYRSAAIELLNTAYPLVTASTRNGEEMLAKCKMWHSHMIGLLRAWVNGSIRDDPRAIAILDDVELKHF